MIFKHCFSSNFRASRKYYFFSSITIVVEESLKLQTLSEGVSRMSKDHLEKFKV